MDDLTPPALIDTPVGASGRPAVDLSSAGQIEVLIPTTGGVTRIVDVRRRGRLKESYVTLHGDFRPLPFSEDYGRFVSGPMIERIDPGPYELTLSALIESGRSWELPVMIAHLAAAQNALARPSAAGNGDNAPPSSARLLWATGMVDADLTPLAAPYHLSAKIEQSRDVFAEASRQGRTILLVIPKGLAEHERRALQAVTREWPAELYEVGSFDDILHIAGLASVPRDQRTFGVDVSSAQALSSSGKPPLIAQYPLAWLAGGAIAAAALAAVALIPSKGSNSPNVGAPIPLVLETLSAADAWACKDRIDLSGVFEANVVTLNEKSYRIPRHSGLCGLRFKNVSGSAIRLALDMRLSAFGSSGDGALFHDIEIAANRSIAYYFARQPAAGKYSLTLDGRDWSAIDLIDGTSRR